MDSFRVSDPQLLLLANGDTPAAVSNARGHLFERFFARLLHKYGYEEPARDRLNVTVDGIEIDVVARHRLTGSRAMAECKAYTSPVAADALTSFYGKVSAARLTEPGVYGLLIVLPRLSANGLALAESIESRDPHFKYLNARAVVAALQDLDMVTEPPPATGPLSDFTLLVTEEGIFGACKLLDAETRLAEAVVVWARSGSVPPSVLSLTQESDFAGGLAVVDARTPEPPAALEVPPVLLVEVRGSSSDFEYQLPASPRYFVGRREPIQVLRGMLSAPEGRAFVLNAQSGWGKSSLALRLQRVVQESGGLALVLDTRTANNPRYVTEVVRRLAIIAAEEGLLSLPSDASWGSLPTALETLGRATWNRSGAPLCVFFDQFENVFKDELLTREFRDLALGVRQVQHPLKVGFAWKTDLVGWTEGHPYQLRDEIRANADVVALKPLGAREVDTLLERLEKQLNQKLVRDLRQRLREYSAGLPWLLKKLAGHVIAEVERGYSQEQLLSEALNVQSLFQGDLQQLQPLEQEALRHVARFAPVPVTEVTERFPTAAIQSLLDLRLVVQVGEKLDTYWDIFRDFLNTGRVPIEESYILRLGPKSVVRLLSEVFADGGNSSVRDLAARLGTSENVIWNQSRELRLFGIVGYEPNRVRLVEEVLEAADREAALRRRVASALRRNRAYSLLARLAERSPGGHVALTSLARDLPGAFPAVDVSATTWLTYARAFALWFQYAGLARSENQMLSLAAEGEAGEGTLLTESTPPARTRDAFPQGPPGAAFALLEALARSEVIEVRTSSRGNRLAVRDLRALGAVRVSEDGTLQVHEARLLVDGAVDNAAVLALMRRLPGTSGGLALLDQRADASPQDVGEVVRAGLNADWSPETIRVVGQRLRSWAARAGLKVVTVPRRRAVASQAGEDPLPIS